MEVQFMEKLRQHMTGSHAELMDELINILSSLSKASICFFATVDKDLQHAHTEVLYSHGELADNFSYDLINTPCQRVLCHEESIYPEKVVELFPEDILLDQLGIEGYVGAPVINKAKERIGILVGLYEEPIEDIKAVSKLYQMTANVVALDVEKQRANAKTTYEDIEELCADF